MLNGAALFVIVTIAAYTLSAGKRADYIAAAYAPGALLAAWWLLRAGPRTALRWPWLTPLAAAATLAVMTTLNELQPNAPSREYGDGIMAFARRAGAAMRAEPRPVAFVWTFDTQIQAVLGYSQGDNNGATRYQPLWALLDRGEPVWVVAGRKNSLPRDFDQWLERRRPGLSVTPVVRSATLPREHSWPERMTLFAIEPES